MITLYHGTCGKALLDIDRRGGLIPGVGNNWKHSVRANPKDVYLTNAYPLHFAVNATNGADVLAILNLELPLTPQLHADEDALEQGIRTGTPADRWDMKRRTIYFRARSHLYPALGSLRALGTCAHRGPIDKGCIKSVTLMDRSTAHLLVLQAMDPTISVLNFHILGSQYQQGARWLAGDEPELALNPKVTRDGIRTMPLAEAVAVVKSHHDNQEKTHEAA